MRLLLASFLIAIFTLGQGQLKAQTTLVPPADLKASYNILEPNVELSWWALGLPYWLHYDNNVLYQMVGSDKAGQLDAAIKYDSTQLSSFHGMEINKFAFFPTDAATTYSFCIWMGTNADSLVYQQPIVGINVNKWNEITIDSLILIDSTQNYYFGYHTQFAAESYPITIDEGPTVKPGYSDLVRSGSNSFASLKELAGLEGNLNIQIYLVPSTPSAKTIELTKHDEVSDSFEPQWINRYVPNRKRFSHLDRSTSPNKFYIYRDNLKIGESTVATYNDVLTEGGVYVYEVSAIYGESESKRSNQATAAYDQSRIPKNTVIMESFINVGTYDDGKENSPSSYGVAKGLRDLEMGVGTHSMVMYHSGTAILGADPFANQESEDRFMKYFMLSGAFPSAFFNGNVFLGGGSSTQSLYEDYRTLYEQAQEILTPFKASGKVTVNANGTYKVDFEAEKMGIYFNDNLKMHFVVTQTNIDYVWSNNRIEQVYNVQTQMPFGAEGKNIDFSNSNIINETVNITMNPLLSVVDFHVLAFIQDDETNEILNGVYLDFPIKLPVVIKVVSGSEPISEASVVVNENVKTTSAEGFVRFMLYDYLTGVEAIVSKTGYADQKVTFDVATTDTITVNLLKSGIDDQNTNYIRLYPNPVNQELKIIATEHGMVKVLNTQGKVVYTGIIEMGQNIINTSELVPGLYIVKYTSNGKTQNNRFIKQ